MFESMGNESDETTSTTLSSEISSGLYRSTATTMKESQIRRTKSEGDMRGLRGGNFGKISTATSAALSRPPTQYATTDIIGRTRSNPLLTQREKSLIQRQRGILTRKTEMPEALVQARRKRRNHEVNPNGVQFHEVHIREYPITVGDNPGGNFGCPLSMDWDHQYAVSLSIEEFETDRPPRRTAAQMSMPSKVRLEILKRAGFTRGEIMEATKGVNIARRERRRTEAMLHIAHIEEAVEKVRRGVRNFMRRSRKKEEKSYILRAWQVHQKLEELQVDQEEIIENLQKAASQTSGVYEPQHQGEKNPPEVTPEPEDEISICRRSIAYASSDEGTAI